MKKNSKNHTKSKRRHAISVHFEDVVYDDVSKVFRASNVSNFDLVAEEMDKKPAEKLQMSNGDTSEQNDFKGTDWVLADKTRTARAGGEPPFGS